MSTNYSVCNDCIHKDTCKGENSDSLMTCFRRKKEYISLKQKTNADRIRSMTDEELAKYFAWLVDDEFPPCCEWEMYGDTIQINAWLEWLTEEVKT